MFNFTGATRKPRNVNLSGRQQSTTKAASIQAARAERQAREAQRRRLKAATDIQRTWRGRRAAERQRQEWRQQWDALLDGGDLTEETVPLAVTLFLGFCERGRRRRRLLRKWEPGDADRLGLMAVCLKDWTVGDMHIDSRLRHLLKGLADVLLIAVEEGSVLEEVLEDVLTLLAVLAKRIPEIVKPSYYAALARISLSGASWTEKMLEAIVAPLDLADDAEVVRWVYRNFAIRYLVTPNLTSVLWDNDLETIRNSVDLGTLTVSLLNDRESWEELDVDARLWMLSYIIYLARYSPPKNAKIIDLTRDKHEADKDYIVLLSLLLSSVSVEVGQRIDVEDISMNDEDSSDEDDSISGRHAKRKDPLPGFVKSQLQSLLQQSAVSSLLSKTKVHDGDAKILAGFALTLLLVFPARRSEIRLWLCLAETLDGVSAVRYFWRAFRETSLFTDIKKESKIAVEKLRHLSTTDASVVRSIEEEWNLVLLFLEIYGFLLSITDDNEFFSATTMDRGRQLLLPDVKDMTYFLKNLAFAMCWWNGEIMGEDKSNDRGGEVYFAQEQQNRGWEVKYLRSTATNVLRMLYTRE